ncbi:hypothetical protein KI387_010781, partial [Taxus chinensis]
LLKKFNEHVIAHIPWKRNNLGKRIEVIPPKDPKEEETAKDNLPWSPGAFDACDLLGNSATQDLLDNSVMINS